MNNKIIITISGKAESGKTTFSNILKKQIEKNTPYKAKVVNYGDALKFVGKEYFNWSGKKDQQGREQIQQIGQCARDIDKAVWIKILDILINTVFLEYDIIIIGDARHNNEITYWKELTNHVVYSICIERMNHENILTEEQRQHPSERGISTHLIDHMVINNKKENLDIDANIIIEEILKGDI